MRRTPWLLRFVLALALVAGLVVASWALLATTEALSEPASEPAPQSTTQPRQGETGEIRRTVDAAPRGVVEVRNTSGSVGVEAWDRDAVEVVGSLGHEVEALTVERRGERVVVSVSRQLGRGAAAHLELRVPAASSLEIEGVQTDVRVEGVGGRVDVRITSGTVRVQGIGAEAGRVELESVSGVLDLEGGFARARLSNVSGPIRIHGTVEELEADSVNGPMDLEVEVGGTARLESIAGPILARLDTAPDTRVEISTFSGRIELQLDPERPARIRATTRSGQLREEVTGEAEIRHDEGVQVLVIDVGDVSDRSPHVELSSFSGDVLLARRATALPPE